MPSVSLAPELERSKRRPCPPVAHLKQSAIVFSGCWDPRGDILTLIAYRQKNPLPCRGKGQPGHPHRQGCGVAVMQRSAPSLDYLLSIALAAGAACKKKEEVAVQCRRPHGDPRANRSATTTSRSSWRS